MIILARTAALTALIAVYAMTGVAIAQNLPPAKAPDAPNRELRDPKACAHARTTIGKGNSLQTEGSSDEALSQKLARSDGVICPPPKVDPEIQEPAPDVGRMPVIPPPGSEGGDPAVRPK